MKDVDLKNETEERQQGTSAKGQRSRRQKVHGYQFNQVQECGGAKYWALFMDDKCDNAGENKKMDDACIEQKMGIKFEYTAVGTPQQNGRVERKFATLYGRIRSMMIDAGIKENLRQKL